MNTRVFSLFVILLVTAQLAPGQTVFTRILFPGPTGTAVRQIQPQGDRIWAVLGSSTSNEVLTVKQPGSSQFTLAGIMPDPDFTTSAGAGVSFTSDGKRHIKMPNLAVTDSEILIGAWKSNPRTPEGEGYWHIKVYKYDPEVTNGIRSHCESYIVDGRAVKPGELNLQGGPFPNYEGSYFMVGSVNFAPRLFTLGRPIGQTTTCELRTTAGSDRDIVWAAKMGGKILALRIVDHNSMPFRVTEMGVFEGGGFTTIVGPAETSPQIIASAPGNVNTVDGVVNWRDQEAIISYSNTSANETVLLHYPSMRRLFPRPGIFTVRAGYGNYLGKLALFSENAVDPASTPQQRILLINDETGETHLVVDSTMEVATGVKFPGILSRLSTLDPSGSVFMNVAVEDNRIYVFQATIPGISKPLSPPTVTLKVNKAAVEENEFVTLSWESTDAHEVEISCFGQVSASGSREVSVSETTTFTAVAKGYGGEAADQVTVTVLSGKLAITAVVDGASFQPGPLVPRSYVTLYFECAEDCGDYAESGPEFVSKLGRISVLVDGTEAWVVFSGGRRVFGGVRQPNQVNFVLPGSLEGRDEAEVVLRLETPAGMVFSAPFKVELVERRVILFTYPARRLPDGEADPDSMLPIAISKSGIIGLPTAPDFGQVQAVPGEVITLWGNGCGKPRVPMADNEAARGDTFSVDGVKVKIDGREAEVLWAGYAPGYPALCQVNVVVPSEITGNDSKYLWLNDNTEPYYWLAVKEGAQEF